MSNLSATSRSDASSGGEVTLNFCPRYGKQGADVHLRYRLTGARGLPVVAVLGGISADAAVIEREDGTPGWWHDQAGPGLGVDTRRYRILSFNFLTLCDFVSTWCRAVSTEDQATALVGLMDALKIDSLQALIGASYGAMIGLCFAACYPQRLEHLVAISGAHRAHPYATALRGLQREIIRAGKANDDSVALARALALTTYLTPEYFAKRFTAPPSMDGDGFYSQSLSFLLHNGRKYSASTHAENYLDLSQSLDLHRVDPELIRTATTLIACDSDSVVPLTQMRELAGRLAGRVRLHVIESVHGHDAFLKEHAALKPLLREALEGERRYVA